jgi:hypothetical protein
MENLKINHVGQKLCLITFLFMPKKSSKDGWILVIFDIALAPSGQASERRKMISKLVISSKNYNNPFQNKSNSGHNQY